jgi:hypothetical protein
MEHNAQRADRLQVAEDRRGDQALPMNAASWADGSWSVEGGKPPGEVAVAVAADRKPARRRRDRPADRRKRNR